MLHDINSMCILKLAYQQDIYRQSEGRSRSHLYLLPGKVNYTQAKGYCAISLLSFMQKTMEKLVTKISTTKYWGMSPTFIIICLQNREVHRNRNASCGYTHTGSSRKQKLYLSILRY